MNSSHSPEFITEMKQRLEAERQELVQELGQLATEHDGEYQGKVPDYGRNEEDNASEISDALALSSTTESNETQLREVESALARINDGTYGITADGEMIPEDRLRANPAATTLVKRS